MPNLPLEPDVPIPFGYNCAWYAMRTNDVSTAISALGLTGVVESPWKQGIDAAYSEKIFVIPPFGDWILAVGTNLFFRGHSPARSSTPMLNKLSKAFGEAQYFATHRVVEAHCWALSRNGKLIRGFEYVGDQGEITWDEGPATDAEAALGERVLEHPSEADLMRIAGAWSINPSELESHFTQPSLGHLGNLSGSAVETERVEVVCEECGCRASFPAQERGTVQECPKCGAYVDVGGEDVPEDWKGANDD
jgi:hypothetical protein